MPFAGYEMAVQYTGIVDEHNTVRNAAGLFDVSHMGEFILEGPDSLKLIQQLTCNDASKLVDGQAQYSALINPAGGIIDDLLVYRFSDNRWMLVVNASNRQKDFDWISGHCHGLNTKLTDDSDRMALLALQGPRALEILHQLTEENLSEIAYYHFRVGAIAGEKDVIISATGYTGAGGFELYCTNDQATAIWHAIMEAGQSHGIKPAGLGARDTLRLEMGFCLYGNDIDDQRSPLEAGLGWITKLSKTFVGSDILKAQKENGPDNKLVGLKFSDRVIARHGAAVIDSDGGKIGEVTSGTMSPSLGYPIALAYVPAAKSTVGTLHSIDIRGKAVTGEVVKLPFLAGKS